MLDRLAAQLERHHRLDDDLLQQNRKLAQCAAEVQTMENKTATANAEREKVAKLHAMLADQRVAVLEKIKALEAEDKAKRQELSNALQQRISDVNVAVEEENKLFAETMSKNAELKEKIAIIASNTESGSDKFEELLKTREGETSGMQERDAELDKVIEQLKTRIADANELSAAKQADHDEVKAQADAFAAKFGEVQAQLSKANDHFNKSKEEQARITKRIKVLEGEVAETSKRASRSLAERDTEQSTLDKLTAQAAQLTTQTQKLETLTKTLKAQCEALQ